jgi:hypothetical protein
MEMGAPVSKKRQQEASSGVPTRKNLKAFFFADPIYNPMGSSGIANASLTDVWDKMKGKKFIRSEYCDDDKARHGIAFSRMCQVLAEALVEITENEYYKKILKDEVYMKAKAEAVGVLPSLRMLTRKLATTSSIQCQQSMSESDFAEHYGIVEAFINNSKSMAKLILSLSSGGGVFFGAYVHEKCTRSYFNFLSNDKLAIAANLRHHYVSGVEFESGELVQK